MFSGEVMTQRILVSLVFAIVVLLFANAAMTQQPVPKPVADITQLMQAMVIPASNNLFNVARQPPKDDKEWTTVRNSAVILAESGNLLMIGSRAKDSVWMKTSLAMVEAGAAALKAAEAKDVDGITEAGNQIIDACEVCHATHWIR